jgi:hypothetical protein
MAILFFRSDIRKRSKSNVSNNNFSFKLNSICSLTSKLGQRFTSIIQGLRFLSINRSKPSNSKQTLSLVGNVPGRHFR